MQKLRILHIIPNFGPGRAERLLLSHEDSNRDCDQDYFELMSLGLYRETVVILAADDIKGFP